MRRQKTPTPHCEALENPVPTKVRHTDKRPTFGPTLEDGADHLRTCSSPVVARKRFDFNSPRIAQALQSPRPDSQLLATRNHMSPSIKRHAHGQEQFNFRDKERKKTPSFVKWRVGECLKSNDVPGCSIYKGLNLLNGQLMVVRQIHKTGLRPTQMDEINGYVDTLVNLSTHPHLVNITAYQEEHHKLNVFAEYVPCGNLKKLLDQFGPLEERVARAFCAQTLKALVYLHTQDIFLQSLNSSSILVAQNSQVKVSPLTPVLASVLMNPTSFQTDIQALGRIVIEMTTVKGATQSTNHLSNAARSFLEQCSRVNLNSSIADANLMAHEFIANAESNFEPMLKIPRV